MDYRDGKGDWDKMEVEVRGVAEWKSNKKMHGGMTLGWKKKGR